MRIFLLVREEVKGLLNTTHSMRDTAFLNQKKKEILTITDKKSGQIPQPSYSDIIRLFRTHETQNFVLL